MKSDAKAFVGGEPQHNFSPYPNATKTLTDEQCDAIFRRWCAANEHGVPYLRCYAETFRHIARDIERELRR